MMPNIERAGNAENRTAPLPLFVDFSVPIVHACGGNNTQNQNLH